MAQEYIKFNGITVKQPDQKMGYGFSTKFTDDSKRTQDGVQHTTPIYTVETLTYKASFLSVDEMKTILQIVARGTPFTLRYFSPYYGVWRSDRFCVQSGSLSIGRLNEDKEKYDSLSFSMEGVNPIR